MRNMLVLLGTLIVSLSNGQSSPFDYRVELNAMEIPGLTGLHSYASAEYEGKWLFVGGRRDGLHARQPFNAFPESQNNDMLRVVDPASGQFWEAVLMQLPIAVQEQLQATNHCFTQQGDSLFIVGGYAYSASAADHITFPRLTVLHVPQVIAAVIAGSVDASSFQTLADERLAVTGGRLVHDGTRFMLVGGHRFDGNYNPMGMPTYTQSYTNSIRRFEIQQSAGGLSLSDYSETVDEVHLHRRDYNLVPWLYADGHESHIISSGVFQPTVDLPFLYPVEIDQNGYTPHPSFNQYLSNYHCPTVSVFYGDQTHALFFGGMSRYYYSNGALVEDNLVPFTRTISRITRTADGVFEEGVFATEMPGLKGSGAEFLVNPSLPSSESGVVLINEILADTIELGFIYGGISSSQLNPFSSNQTGNTSADATWYKVKLIRDALSTQDIHAGQHGKAFQIFPNPVEHEMKLRSDAQFERATYHILDAQGRLIQHGELTATTKSQGGFSIAVDPAWSGQTFNVVVVFDDKYTAVQTVNVR